MLTLLSKEIKEIIRARFTKYKSNIFKAFISLLFYCLLIAFLTYLFIKINERLSLFNANEEILSLSLILITIVFGITSLPTLEKNLMSSSNLILDKTLPFKRIDLTLAKALIIYLNSLFSSIFFSLPILLSYLLYKELSLAYYLLSLFIILFIPLLSLLFSLIILYPYKRIKSFLNNHLLIEFILGLILASLFLYLYYLSFNLFLGLINNNRLEYIFNSSNLNILKRIISFSFPFSLINEMFSNLNSSFFNLAVSLFIFFILCVLDSFLIYLYIRFFKEHTEKTKLKKKTNKIVSVSSALIKKEFISLFRNKDNLFSYFLVMISVPFLSLILIYSFSELIVNSFIYLEALYLPLVFLTIGLFFLSVSLSSSITNLSEKEKALTKSFPLSLKKIASLKLVFSCSFPSILLTLSYIFLLFLNLISFNYLLYSYFINLVMLIFVLTGVSKRSLKEDNSFSYSSLLEVLFILIFSLGLFYLTYYLFKSIELAFVFVILFNLALALIRVIFYAFYLGRKTL